MASGRAAWVLYVQLFFFFFFFQRLILEMSILKKEHEYICHVSWQFCHLTSSLFVLSKQSKMLLNVFIMILIFFILSHCLL